MKISRLPPQFVDLNISTLVCIVLFNSYAKFWANLKYGQKFGLKAFRNSKISQETVSVEIPDGTKCSFDYFHRKSYLKLAILPNRNCLYILKTTPSLSIELAMNCRLYRLSLSLELVTISMQRTTSHSRKWVFIMTKSLPIFSFQHIYVSSIIITKINTCIFSPLIKTKVEIPLNSCLQKKVSL